MGSHSRVFTARLRKPSTVIDYLRVCNIVGKELKHIDKAGGVCQATVSLISYHGIAQSIAYARSLKRHHTITRSWAAQTPTARRLVAPFGQYVSALSAVIAVTTQLCTPCLVSCQRASAHGRWTTTSIHHGKKAARSSWSVSHVSSRGQNRFLNGSLRSLSSPPSNTVADRVKTKCASAPRTRP